MTEKKKMMEENP